MQTWKIVAVAAIISVGWFCFGAVIGVAIARRPPTIEEEYATAMRIYNEENKAMDWLIERQRHIQNDVLIPAMAVGGSSIDMKSTIEDAKKLAKDVQSQIDDQGARQLKAVTRLKTIEAKRK